MSSYRCEYLDSHGEEITGRVLVLVDESNFLNDNFLVSVQWTVTMLSI